MSGLSKDVVVINELGLHARSATRIATLAQQATSGVWVIRGAARADATSVVDILTLACEKGSTITLKVDDPSDRTTAGPHDCRTICSDQAERIGITPDRHVSPVFFKVFH